MNLSFKRFYYPQLIILTTLLVISSCSNNLPSRPNQTTKKPYHSALNKTAKEYLSEAMTAAPNQKDNLQSFAAMQLTQEADLSHAKKIARRPLAKPTTPATQTIRNLAKARIANYEGHYKTGLYYLRQNRHHIPQEFLFDWYTTQAAAFIGLKNHSQTIAALSHAYDLLPTNNRYDYLRQYWPQLTITEKNAPPLPPSLLQNEFSCWQELAQKTQMALQHPQTWNTIKSQWQQRHPAHPGNPLLKSSLLKATLWPNPDQIKHIGLILPLHGIFSKQATTIEYGLLDALYQYNNQHPKQLITLSIFDSSTHSSQEMFHFVKNPSIDIIIGPLKKENITLISQNKLKPILALNPTPSDRHNKNMYWIDLTQKTEADNMVENMALLGYKRPLIISQPTPLGHKISNEFLQHWNSTQKNSAVMALLPLDKKDNSSSIKHILGINTSKEHAQIIKVISHKKIIFAPNRRQDIDAIFLATNGTKAREVVPLIQYYYAQDLPLFATSMVMRGNPSSYQNQDLEGMRYLNYPLLSTMQNTTSRKPEVKQIKWPKFLNQHPFFFKIGYDAFNLALRLNILSDMPLAQHQGLTGSLSMHQNHIISRKLQWTVIHHGLPQPVSHR